MDQATAIMDTNQLIQIISVALIFFTTFIAALLPLKVVGRSKQAILTGSDRVLSICNCLAGGVFLTTCFLGLIPSAREKFNKIFSEREIDLNGYPVTEAVVVGGFYLILIIEQIISAVQEMSSRQDDSYLFEMDQLSLKTPDHIEDGSYSESDSDEFDLFERGENLKKPMLAKTKPNGNIKKPNATRKKPKGKHWHGGHGHSHLGHVNSGNLTRSFVLLFALSVHSVFEGMALGVQESQKMTSYLVVAILAHESLAAFSLGSNLVTNAVSTRVVVIYSFLFSIMIPVGIAVGIGIHSSQGFAAQLTSAVTQAVAAGIFIFVTFFEIINNEFERHKDRFLKVVISLVGFILLAVLEVFAK